MFFLSFDLSNLPGKTRLAFGGSTCGEAWLGRGPIQWGDTLTARPLAEITLGRTKLAFSHRNAAPRLAQALSRREETGDGGSPQTSVSHL